MSPLLGVAARLLPLGSKRGAPNAEPSPIGSCLWVFPKSTESAERRRGHSILGIAGEQTHLRVPDLLRLTWSA